MKPDKPLRTSFPDEMFMADEGTVAGVGNLLLKFGLNNMEIMATALMLAAELHRMSYIGVEGSGKDSFIDLCLQAYSQTTGLFTIKGDD